MKVVLKMYNWLGEKGYDPINPTEEDFATARVRYRYRDDGIVHKLYAECYEDIISESN